MESFLSLAFITAVLLNCFQPTYSHVIDDCERGDVFWCSSRKNALKCQKLEECFPTTEASDYIEKTPVTDPPADPEENPFQQYIDSPVGEFIG